MLGASGAGSLLRAVALPIVAPPRAEGGVLTALSAAPRGLPLPMREGGAGALDMSECF